jgi:hypothetical protein
MKKLIVLSGEKYGRLSVVKEVPTSTKERRFECHCDCGKIGVFDLAKMRSGNSKSCGCYRRESAVVRATKHGDANAPVYRIYNHMVAGE